MEDDLSLAAAVANRKRVSEEFKERLRVPVSGSVEVVVELSLSVQSL